MFPYASLIFDKILKYPLVVVISLFFSVCLFSEFLSSWCSCVLLSQCRRMPVSEIFHWFEFCGVRRTSHWQRQSVSRLL